MVGIKDSYHQFNKEIDSIFDVLNKSIKLYEDSSISYDQDLHFMITETCFVNLFNSWEYFLEKTFIFYLLGHQSMSGKVYPCCVKPLDEKHAYDILKGTKTYPKWTDHKERSCLARLYFENSGPFACLDENPIELHEILDIRNSIAHRSEKAVNDFKKVQVRKLGVFEDSRPAEFLLRFVERKKVTYFSYYAEFLKFYADKICDS